MYYRINVSLNGRHFFATADHSITTELQAKAIMKDFKQRFTAGEGFEITCTLWQKVGHDQNFSEEV